MTEIRCQARWKEELVATGSAGRLVFEFMMGIPHVYFPTETRWSTQVPAWALGRWQEYRTAVESWCAAERVPFSLDDNAHVSAS